jgi:hypothetical protein
VVIGIRLRFKPITQTGQWEKRIPRFRTIPLTTQSPLNTMRAEGLQPGFSKTLIYR